MKFEDVLATLDMKEFEDMSDQELAEIVQRLRSIRTDVPESKHRRKKHRSKDHLVKQLLQMAQQMKKDNPTMATMKDEDVVEIIMKQPQIMAVLAGEDVDEEVEGDDEE
jgi:lipid II:glycine glycyltransferase (peptidoglycan interpeptide bridge formation enzyme)